MFIFYLSFLKDFLLIFEVHFKGNNGMTIDQIKISMCMCAKQVKTCPKIPGRSYRKANFTSRDVFEIIRLYNFK